MAAALPTQESVGALELQAQKNRDAVGRGNR
jgi:hypothetical protein